MTTTTTMTTCANCTRPFADTRDQCPHCGFPVQAQPVGASVPTSTNLVSCAACGHQVSVQARACPQCGQPMRKSSGFPLLAFITGVVCTMVMAAYYMVQLRLWGEFHWEGQDGGSGPTQIMFVLFTAACLGFARVVYWRAQQNS